MIAFVEDAKLRFVWDWLLWQAHRDTFMSRILSSVRLWTSYWQMFWTRPCIRPLFESCCFFFSYFCVFRVVCICLAMPDITFYRINFVNETAQLSECSWHVPYPSPYPFLLRLNFLIQAAVICDPFRSDVTSVRLHLGCSPAHMTKIHSLMLLLQRKISVLIQMWLHISAWSVFIAVFS